MTAYDHRDRDTLRRILKRLHELKDGAIVENDDVRMIAAMLLNHHFWTCKIAVDEIRTPDWSERNHDVVQIGKTAADGSL